MATSGPTIRETIAFTKDGEWGAGEPGAGLMRMRVIRGTDFEAARFGDLDRVPTRFIPISQGEKKRLLPWDVLIETAGGSKDRPTGRTLLVTPSLLEMAGAPVVCASFARVLRFDTDLVDPRYMYWTLQDMYNAGLMEQHQVQHTGVARFQFTRFADAVRVPVPALPVQRRIAAILGALDDKIDLNRRMNRTLEEMAQAIFKSWFIDFDGYTDLVDSELGPVPRGWEVSEIGSAVKVVGGSTPSTANPSFWEGGLHHWTTPKDLSAATSPLLLTTERLITDAGVASISSGLLPVGTFLLSSRAPIGYTAIARVPVAINQGYIAIPPGGRLSSLFLLHWTKTNLDVIKSRAGGTTFQEISKSNFRPILVAVPPVENLGRFDRVVGPLFDRIEVNERQTATLAALRDTLLPKLISGEVRVPETAEVAPECRS